MEPVSSRRWEERVSGLSADAVARLAASLGLLPLTGRILALRGIENAEAGAGFLRSALAALPDPFLLPGMRQATQRLTEAIERGEPIRITSYNVCYTKLLRAADTEHMQQGTWRVP